MQSSARRAYQWEPWPVEFITHEEEETLCNEASDPNPKEKQHPPSIRSILAKHNLTSRIKPSTEELDIITGKRLGPDTPEEETK